VRQIALGISLSRDTNKFAYMIAIK